MGSFWYLVPESSVVCVIVDFVREIQQLFSKHNEQSTSEGQKDSLINENEIDYNKQWAPLLVCLEVFHNSNACTCLCIYTCRPIQQESRKHFPTHCVMLGNITYLSLHTLYLSESDKVF